jgi:four helix bundle protein
VSELQHAKSFRDLIVHQKARLIAKVIFEQSKSFPREEAYSLTDQIRRAARSIGAQIAEAWGKRRYERHFVSKLTDAVSEQLETEHWMEIALDCGYLTKEQSNVVLEQLSEIGRMLNSMINKADQFCGSPIADDPED